MSTPGYGAFARVVSSTSGKEWMGEVFVFGPHGEPFLRDAETAETRWFPASWLAATIAGPPDFDPGPCTTCYIPHPDEDDDAEHAPQIDRACPVHGDPEHVASLILQKARSRA